MASALTVALEAAWRRDIPSAALARVAPGRTSASAGRCHPSRLSSKLRRAESTEEPPLSPKSASGQDEGEGEGEGEGAGEGEVATPLARAKGVGPSLLGRAKGADPRSEALVQ